MPRKSTCLNEKDFDYEKFQQDTKTYCALVGKSMERVSTDVLLRSRSYLSVAFAQKKLPVNIAVALAKWINADLKSYAIKKGEKKPAEKSQEQKEGDGSGWACVLKVDEEIGVAMVKLLKDGQEIATGRSYTYGSDIEGVVQGISYAAHMCYKFVQQDKIAHQVMVEEGVGTEEDEEENPAARVIFKDWIKRYENDNTKAGTLARYVKSHYEKIPATGKKKIRSYLRLNKGEAHLATFDTLWSQFFKWADANAAEGNKRMGL